MASENKITKNAIDLGSTAFKLYVIYTSWFVMRKQYELGARSIFGDYNYLFRIYKSKVFEDENSKNCIWKKNRNVVRFTQLTAGYISIGPNFWFFGSEFLFHKLLYLSKFRFPKKATRFSAHEKKTFGRFLSTIHKVWFQSVNLRNSKINLVQYSKSI